MHLSSIRVIRAICGCLYLSHCVSAQPIQAGNLRISPASHDLSIEYETGGRSGYTPRPEVPPGFSGVTIGVGYDCGYNTPAQIAEDWGGVLPASQVARLQGVAGKTGATARAVLIRVSDIRIPWESALKVYETRTVPRFARDTERAYPGLLKLDPSIQGIMLSTTFNRGSAMSPYERRKELVWSHDDILQDRVSRLATYQLQMRRLWPTIPGLQRRYAAHAGLIQQAVNATAEN